MRKFVIAAGLSTLMIVPLSADLKYTQHMQIQKSATATDQPANPMLGMMADAVMKQMVPGGEADVVYLVGEKRTRSEYLQHPMRQCGGGGQGPRPGSVLAVLN